MGDRTALVVEGLARDAASSAHGWRVLRADDDGLAFAFDVGPRHLNPAGVCHGGVIFHLADSIIGSDANSRDADTWLTAGSSIKFLAPVRAGETLVATSRLRFAAGASTRWYEAEVVSGDRLVAVAEAQMVRLRSAG